MNALMIMQLLHTLLYNPFFVLAQQHIALFVGMWIMCVIWFVREHAIYQEKVRNWKYTAQPTWFSCGAVSLFGGSVQFSYVVSRQIK